MRENSSHQRHHSPASLALLPVEVSLDFLDFILYIGRLSLQCVDAQVVFVSDLSLHRLVHSGQDVRPAGASFLSRAKLFLLPDHGEEVSSNAVSGFRLQLFLCLPFLKYFNCLKA